MSGPLSGYSPDSGRAANHEPRPGEGCFSRAHAPELVKELVAYSTKVIIVLLILRITAGIVAIYTGCGGA